MSRFRFGLLSLFCGLLLFSSCSDFFSPVRDHLEEYSTTVIVLGHEVLTEWAPDRAGITNVPSAIPAQIRFSLQNPRNYDLVPSLRFTDPAVESSLPVNAYILALSPDRQFIDLQLSSEFLAMHEYGGNISFELTFTEPQTQRVFPSHQLALRANTAPPIPAGARVMVDNSTSNYIVCFNLDLSDPLQDDLDHITVNNSVYTVSSITTGGTQNITFNEPGISSTEPAMGTSIVSGLDGFIVDSGMTQIYVTTVISYVPTEYHSFTIQVTDTGGITRQRTTTTGAPLDPVEFSDGVDPIPPSSEEDLTPNTIGNASLVMNSPTSGATMHYQIVSNGTPAAPQTSTASSHTITLPEGSHVISAYATQYGYSESVPVSVTIHVIDEARIYVHNIDGDDDNRGTLGSPCKTISTAYSKLPNKDNAANTIVLLSDITEVDQPSGVTSNQLAYLNIIETTQLTIDGQGLYALDAEDAVLLEQTRGMYLAGSASLDLTLQDLTICNANFWQNGAGFYIWNTSARVIFDGCVIENNVSSGNFGAGVYFRGTSLTLHGTTVINNKLEEAANMYGAGVYAGYCSFTADQGTVIRGNGITANSATCNGNGAGLYAESCTSLELDTTTIADNYINGLTINHGQGAGMYITSVNPTLNGCVISSNEISNCVESRGAGALLSNASPTFTDVDVIGNEINSSVTNSTGYGAGLHCNSLGTTSSFDSSCRINTNSITVVDDSYGAGIYLNTGNLILNGSEISGNYGIAANGYGSGIYMRGVNSTNYAEVTMNGGVITGNIANSSTDPLVSGYGGGVYMDENTTFTMNDGSTTNNSGKNSTNSSAVSFGDGVCANPSSGSATFILNEGNISGNASTGSTPTNTAFYLDGSSTCLLLNTEDVVIDGNNVVYLDNGAYILANAFLSADPVATLKFPDLYPTSYFTLVGAPAINYYKFLVEDLSDGPYCINADGNLSKITEASVSTMSDLNSQLASAPTDGTTVLIELGTGTYTVPAGAPAFSITSDRNIRIIPQGAVSFNNANYSTLFAVSGHLLIDGANLTIDCLGPPTVSRYAPLFDCGTSESSLVARNISIINSGIIAVSNQDGSLVSLQDESTAVLEVFRYYESPSILVNSATSALNLGVDSVCHFVSGSIENFNAEHTFSGTVAGVATLPAGATLHIHDGTFTGNSLEGTSSVAGPGTLINDTGIEPQ